MNDQFSDFETQLRKLAPVRCDDLVEDTFYRAGWHAAMQSLQQTNVVAGRRKWSVGSFTSGVLCGLMCCVLAITAWSSLPDTTSSVQIVKTVVPDQETMQAEVVIPKDDPIVEHPPQSQPVNLFSTVTSIFQWPSPGRIEFRNSTSIPVRSLSVAAQYQWSNMVVSESTIQRGRTSQTTSSEVSDRSPLRAFPVSEAELLDLL